MWPEIPQKWQKWTNLGCVCFGWKMISGNHFPPNPHVWLQRKMKFFENSFPVDQYLLLWLGNNFTLLFSIQIISGKRERERERREKREPRSERERKEEETLPAIDERCDRLTSALVDRAPRRSRLRARSSDERLSDERACRSRPSSIAPLVGRSHLHRAISSSPPLRDLNLTGFDEFFCWVLFLLWMSVELIHYLHVYSWGSVWKIRHLKHFL